MDLANTDKDKFNLGIELNSANINQYLDLEQGKVVDS